MALVNMRDLLYHARHHGYAVGAFDIVSLEFLEGIMAAAERCRAPVILNLAESRSDRSSFELLMPAVESAARRATVPVTIHLEHSMSLDAAVSGIKLGCNSLSLTTSQQPLAENIRLTRSVVEMAHTCGVPVEGNLCDVPGVEADAASHYVKQTGVDFVAVSIDAMHSEPEQDYQRLRQINQMLEIPLVIHDGTGLNDEQFRQLITSGVARINYHTALADIADNVVQDKTRRNHQGSYICLTAGVKEAISTEAEHCMRLWKSAGRATELLDKCSPWSPVEHLIIYNVTGVDRQQMEAIMENGRHALGAIPGVREVVTGHAIKPDAKYQYTWLVRFCHAAVIDSYREHPAHTAFADNQFRPIAGDRISIDYQVIESVSNKGY